LIDDAIYSPLARFGRNEEHHTEDCGCVTNGKKKRRRREDAAVHEEIFMPSLCDDA
jgi:hypothetical protein